jgi:hypothetical protein
VRVDSLAGRYLGSWTLHGRLEVPFPSPFREAAVDWPNKAAGRGFCADLWCSLGFEIYSPAAECMAVCLLSNFGKNKPKADA